MFTKDTRLRIATWDNRESIESLSRFGGVLLERVTRSCMGYTAVAGSRCFGSAERLGAYLDPKYLTEPPYPDRTCIDLIGGVGGPG